MAVISTLKKFAQKYKKHPSRSLLDPDPRGKMTADPDPQPWVIYIIQCTVYTIYIRTYDIRYSVKAVSLGTFFVLNADYDFEFCSG